jgi:putative ABC transport system ATP-binding protein
LAELAIEVKGAVKEYRMGELTVQILKGVDLKIQKGDFVVILGASGSGKSTLLNQIALLDTPTSGKICIAGVEASSMSERQRTELRLRKIGIVFQFFNLIPTLTVLENVLLPAELASRNGTATHARALDLLTRVGLADRLAAFPDKLSGGEQQRVALARALVQNPRLVLADEPTGNLDARTGDEIMNLLDEMTRRAGKTLLMVTHSRQIAARADRVLAIQDGQLVEEPVNSHQ